MPRQKRARTVPNSPAPERQLRGRYADRNQPVLPRLCELSREIVGRVLLDEILNTLPPEDRKCVLHDKLFPKMKRPRPDLILRRSKEGIHSDLSFLVQWLGHLGYHPQVLLSRKGAAAAYRLLVEAIGVLGPVPTPPSRDVPRDAAFYDAQLDRVRTACGQFCTLFQPACWTAYFRNCRQNRVCLLGEAGLRFPEAMRSFNWLHDLPAQVIFGEGDVGLYPPFPGGQPALSGTFAEREGVDTKRLVGVRMAWGRSRVALFLNWRKDHLPAVSDALSGLWKLMDEAGPSGPDPEKVREAVRPLDLAVRYFVGWLTAGGVDVAQQYEAAPTVTPDALIRQVGEAARLTRPEDRALRSSQLVSAVEQVLKLPDRADPDMECHVHWVEKSPDGAGKLVFQKGDYENHPPEAEPPFSLALGHDGLAKDGSICAQAAAWKAGLFIRDVSRRFPHLNKSWADVQVRRVNYSCQSELAVPIFLSRPRGEVGEREVAGVVSVECRTELEEADLRRAELVTQLYQKLSHALGDATLKKGDRNVLDELVRPKEMYRSFQRLCHHYCKWVRKELEADIVHLCIYDARVHLFRPMGITVSEGNVRRLLADSEALANVGLGMYDEGTRKRLSEQYKEGGERGGIHGLIEHAVASLLQPKPEGLTEKIFRTKRGGYQADARQHAGRADPPTLTYAKARLGLPFSQDDNATPDGVLWVCWSTPPTTVAGIGAVGEGSAEAIVEGVGARLAPVSETVAAMYAVHRYCYPDQVADPLPLRR